MDNGGAQQRWTTSARGLMEDGFRWVCPRTPPDYVPAALNMVHKGSVLGLSTAVRICPRQLGQILLLYQPIWLANPSIEQYHIVCPDVQAFFNLDLLGEDESVERGNTQ